MSICCGRRAKRGLLKTSLRALARPYRSTTCSGGARKFGVLRSSQEHDAARHRPGTRCLSQQFLNIGQPSTSESLNGLEHITKVSHLSCSTTTIALANSLHVDPCNQEHGFQVSPHLGCHCGRFYRPSRDVLQLTLAQKDHTLCGCDSLWSVCDQNSR